MSETEVVTEFQVENTDDLDAFTSDFFGEKKEVPTDAKPEANQEEVEDTEDGDAEAQETDDTVTQDEDTVTEPVPKPKSKAQERIEELVKQKHEVERAAKAEIDELRREFEAFKAKPVEVAKTLTEPDPTDVDADGIEKYPLGEFDPLYIKDLTRYTLESERAAVRAAEQEEQVKQEQVAAATALHESWTAKVEPAKAKYPDFAEKGEALLNGFGDLQPDYAQYLSTVLMSMDHGPDVLYYLANNPDEAVKIVNSGAQKATIALGRIEAKFFEEEAQKVLAKPKLSKAPAPPIATARGTGGNAGGVSDDTDDLDAFESKFFTKRR